jgi:HlyD family secretion protein
VRRNERARMKKKAMIGIAIPLVVVGALFGPALLRSGRKPVQRYKLEPVSRGDIEAVVTASGTVKAITTVEVGSQVSGRIARMYVDYNSLVKQGQVLAELDPLPLQAKVGQSQANYLSALAAQEKAKVSLENLKTKYERSASLAGKNLVSPDELESARAGYLGARTDAEKAASSVEQAKSELDSSRLDLGYATIRSPIDGIVISRNMQVGQTVQASFQAVKMFEIANDLGKMRVECDVDEADVGKVKIGQPVRFTVDAFPEDEFQGTIDQVRYSPTTSSNVVTYTTIIDVDNPELKLRPGMTAAVTIVTGAAKGALCLPVAALKFKPNLPAEEIAKIAQGAAAAKRLGKGRAVVWHLDEKGALRAAAVGAGISNSAYVEILAGDLKEGQKVITGYDTGQAAATSGMRPPGGPMMMMGGPPPPPPRPR